MWSRKLSPLGICKRVVCLSNALDLFRASCVIHTDFHHDSIKPILISEGVNGKIIKDRMNQNQREKTPCNIICLNKNQVI